jgi:hypothetical protein
MKTTADKLNEILGILKGAKYELKNQDEFGFELVSEDASHKVSLQQTTITFNHTTNREITYSIAANAQDVRKFLKENHSFDEATYKKPEVEVAGETKPKAKVEKAPKPVKEKKVKVVVEKEEKGPSIRQEVLKMIESAGGTVTADDRAKILASLKTTFPEREEADLKNKISLYKGYYSKGQRSKGYVKPVAAATVVVEPAPETAAPVEASTIG